MAVHAGEHPGRGITEALTDIFAPAPRALGMAGLRNLSLTPFGGPAKLAAGTDHVFAGDQIFIGPARGVRQTGPYEMEDLVDQNARELFSIPLQPAVQHDLPLVNERAGMDGLADTCFGKKLTPMA